MNEHVSITPLNENAVVVSFENVIDDSINSRVIALGHAVHRQPFKGYIECVPSYSSLAVFYDVLIVRSQNPQRESAYEIVHEYLSGLLKTIKKQPLKLKQNIIEIPVLYDGEDLHYVADFHQQKAEDIVRIHTTFVYRVFMIGFLPGFAYMGTLDNRIETPRKTSPRKQVPAGSVGIAGRQTGIYPQESPGGWQLLGRTPIRMFDKTKISPCLLAAGDHVKFVPITKEEFDLLDEY